MISRSILKILKKAKQPTNILLNILIGGYSYKKLKMKAFYPTLYDLSKIKETEINTQLLEKEKQKFYVFLSRLKKQGFVEKEQKKDKTFWKITPRGEKRLEKLEKIFRFPKIFYKQEKSEGINIIVFDIPEKHRAKRDWLRHALSSLGFVMLQRSVWIGKNKLPEEFLKSLAELDLVDFVQIFRVLKTGSLKRD